MAKISALSERGVSCVLVIGGSGDYFEVADCVVAMDCFKASDVTSRAHDIARQHGQDHAGPGIFGSMTARTASTLHQGEPHCQVDC